MMVDDVKECRSYTEWRDDVTGHVTENDILNRLELEVSPLTIRSRGYSVGQDYEGSDEAYSIKVLGYEFGA
jgi:hypothetical protein